MEGFQIKTSNRSRSVRISVFHDGRVVLTKPRYVSEAFAVRFAEQKETWIRQKQSEFAKRNIQKLGVGTLTEFRNYKQQALELVTEKIKILNSKYGFKIGRITIRKTTSRWGSCSKKGNLNFNYKIVFLTTHLQDYLIVHELCHLKEFNHGKRFWELVEQTIPDYSEKQKQLRKMH